jgi:hypothetical protein
MASGQWPVVSDEELAGSEWRLEISDWAIMVCITNRQSTNRQY